MISATRAKLKVAQYAEENGVTKHTVLDWIRSGQLQAINVARKPGGRPSWRISQEAIDRFEAARSATPPPVATRKRRRADPAVREFY